MSQPTSAPSSTPSNTLPGSLVALIALVGTVGPLANDMYLPAFPQMALDLHTAASSIQLTLTTFLLGLALGHLVIGPLSDQWGRRGLLLGGAALCTLASFACAAAPSVELLILARFLQGFGGAAGMVLSRAVLTDRSSGEATAKLFSLLMLIGGVAPVIAPLLGGLLITQAGGWRGVFWALGGLSGVLLLATALLLPESLPASQRRSGGVATLLHDTRQIFHNRTYMGYTLTFVASMAAMFAYIAASPFVLQNILGLSPLAYSGAFAANALGLTVVSGLNAGLIAKHGAPKLLSLGVRLLAAFSVLLLLDIALLHTPMLPTLVLLFGLTSSLGLIFGNAGGLAAAGAREMAGTGSAILGVLQFALAAIVAPLVGLGGEHNALPMGLTIVVAALLAWGFQARVPQTS